MKLKCWQSNSSTISVAVESSPVLHSVYMLVLYHTNALYLDCIRRQKEIMSRFMHHIHLTALVVHIKIWPTVTWITALNKSSQRCSSVNMLLWKPCSIIWSIILISRRNIDRSWTMLFTLEVCWAISKHCSCINILRITIFKFPPYLFIYFWIVSNYQNIQLSCYLFERCFC